MDKIINILKTAKFTHHAYGFESHGLRNTDIDEYLSPERFEYVFSQHYDFLKINDIRTLKLLQSEKTGKESLFIISFVHTNKESQNALLKIIEEPTPNTIFFFIFPNAKNLLATILSRIELISMNRFLGEQKHRINVSEFIKMSLFERLDYIKKNTNKKDKEIEVFEKQDLQFLLDDLEIIYFKQAPSNKRNNILEKILNSRGYMNANGVSIKMILDAIALHL